jgi:hypothetical protein
MPTRACGISPLLVAVALTASLSAQKNDKDAKSPVAGEAQRPKLALKAQPSIGIAPARVVLTAEFTGGSNDFEEYYCPTVRWEWGDLTSSESSMDCPPYEAGKTEIKRRFTVDHRFDRAGSYKVYFRIRHGSKEVAATSTTVKLQPGVHDIDP